MEKTPRKRRLRDITKPFIFSGTAAMISSACCHPIEIMKVRIQLYGEKLGLENRRTGFINPWDIVKTMYREEKLRGFFKGITISMYRQAIFGSIKLGIYRVLLENYMRGFKDGDKYVRIRKRTRTKYLLFSGFCASVVGSPLDLTLTRIQGDNTLPPHLRRNYKNLVHAIRSIVQEEGVMILWRGFNAFSCRVMTVTVTSVLAFEETKHWLLTMKDTDVLTFKTRAQAIIIASLFLPVTALPFDNIKTKMQKMVPVIENGVKVMPYKGMWDCIKKTVHREGPFGLWSGFLVYYSFKAPNNMINLVCLDYLVHWFGDDDVKNKR